MTADRKQFSTSKQSKAWGEPSQKAFVFLNPKAGQVHIEEFRAALALHLLPPRWTSEIHEMTGGEDIAAICGAACDRGVSLVISAGGDGTLVGVANALVRNSVPLGILPLGTGNNLARALSIPLKLVEALALIVGEHAIMEVDALKVGERYFFSNVSVGISPQVIRGTKPVMKRILGRLAYLLALIKHSRLFRRHEYLLTLDGQTQSIRAAEVMVSNNTLLEKPPFLFGPPETLSDGQFEIYLVKARTLGDYIRMIWGLFRRPGKSTSKMSHLVATHAVRIDAQRGSQLVQADGELIGRTPVEVRLVPKAIRIVIPNSVVNA